MKNDECAKARAPCTLAPGKDAPRVRQCPVMQERDIQDRAYKFALRVVRLCGTLQRSSVGRVLVSQLLRAGTSIGANLEEAQAAQSKKDFIAKVSIARKEAFETRYWLRLVADAGWVSRGRMAGIIAECDEIAKVLSAIVLSARKRA